MLFRRLPPLLPLLALSLPPQAVYAQDATVPAPVTETRRATRGARQETLKQITERLSQTTRLRVLADSAISRTPLSAPEDTVTAATLEDYLTRLTRRLPAGTVWLKVYLPPSGGTRPFSPDAVAQLARAQMELLGRAAPNTVQIQGKILTLTEAAPVIQTLGLEPVYILTSKASPGVRSGLSGGLGTSELMDALTKQLGVASVTDIPPGTYKVSLPGADGASQQATVEVDETDGKRRISVRMGSTTER